LEDDEDFELIGDVSDALQPTADDTVTTSNGNADDGLPLLHAIIQASSKLDILLGDRVQRVHCILLDLEKCQD